MLTIHVAQLLKSPEGTTRRSTFVEAPEVLGEAEVIAPVRGEVALVRVRQGILADCSFETALALECARCLAVAVTPVSGRFQEEFVPSVDLRTGLPRAVEADSEAFLIGEDHVLDLAEAIRQHVLMAAPLQPLCRPDCRGLCPECGHDLNTGPCACAPVDETSPFSALRQLLVESDGPPARRA
ncbi:MAG TPA: DUF177 domain-containing protein [Chloroflexota bacterium]|nr:DUF177 domain-containing protein [Chloroflexota bacterium]